MRKIFCLLLIILLLFCYSFSPVVTAQAENRTEVSFLRVGGGGSGGSGGGGSGGSSSSGSGSGSHSSGGYYGFSGPYSFLSDIFGYIIMAVVSFGSVILFKFRLSKSAINSRKLMKMLDSKDNAWKYKNILPQIRKTYFSVQNAWTKLDMSPAKEYISEELYQSLQTKLDWMKYRKQQNVLKNIKLTESVPVSVHDDVDDNSDYIWFYIKGRMVDYTINTENQEITDGNTLPQSFVEYWKFVRRPNGRWVLDKILQEDEKDKITFQ